MLSAKQKAALYSPHMLGLIYGVVYAYLVDIAAIENPFIYALTMPARVVLVLLYTVFPSLQDYFQGFYLTKLWLVAYVPFVFSGWFSVVWVAYILWVFILVSRR